MAKTLGFGVLGAGLVAPFHAKSIVASEGGRLVAFCDLNAERVQAMASDYGVTAYDDLGAMSADPAIDVINVALPNHLHFDAIMQCAEAGKHVITEKPPAMSLAETDAMVEACASRGLKFGCTVQCRVRAAIQAMRKAIADGRFGKLLHADAFMKWFRPVDYYHMDAWRSLRKAGAGVTVQHAFHYIDLLQYLVGPAARVQARMTNLVHPDVALEDTLLAFVDFECGAQGVVEASTALWPGTDVRIEVNGTKGTAIMTGEKMATWTFEDDQPEDEAIRRLGDESQATAAGGAADFGFADHQVVVEDFIEAVNTDRDVIIPVASVRPTLEMVLAMYQSAAKGTSVDLPIIDDPSIW